MWSAGPTGRIAAHLGALLLGYYSEDGKLIYAGRGMTDNVLADLRCRLDPLARASMPLSAPPPRKTRFGSPRPSRASGRAAARGRNYLSDLDR